MKKEFKEGNKVLVKTLIIVVSFFTPLFLVSYVNWDITMAAHMGEWSLDSRAMMLFTTLTTLIGFTISFGMLKDWK